VNRDIPSPSSSSGLVAVKRETASQGPCTIKREIAPTSTGLVAMKREQPEEETTSPHKRAYHRNPVTPEEKTKKYMKSWQKSKAASRDRNRHRKSWRAMQKRKIRQREAVDNGS
jgi:hypothetical protein